MDLRVAVLLASAVVGTGAVSPGGVFKFRSLSWPPLVMKIGSRWIDKRQRTTELEDRGERKDHRQYQWVVKFSLGKNTLLFGELAGGLWTVKWGKGGKQQRRW